MKTYASRMGSNSRITDPYKYASKLIKIINDDTKDIVGKECEKLDSIVKKKRKLDDRTDLNIIQSVDNNEMQIAAPVSNNEGQNATPVKVFGGRGFLQKKLKKRTRKKRGGKNNKKTRTLRKKK